VETQEPRDRVAVVTGSSKGWGRAVAQALAGSGVRVVVNGLTKPDDMEETVSAIRAAGGEATGVIASVATRDGAEAIIGRALEAYGRIDILVNNAGIRRNLTLLETSDDDWDEVIAVNLRGVFLCTKLAAQRMIERGSGGRIVNMAGGAAIRGVEAHGATAGSKGGVLAATYTWAKELAPYGITVNCARGAVRTSGNAELRARLKSRAGAAMSDRDLGFYEPVEAAPLVVWLTSTAAAHVTGRFIGIDGPRVTVWDASRPAATLHHFPAWTAAALEASVGSVVAQLNATPEEPVAPAGGGKP
jgi:NAD(P)-dependent dehydrogenase (short-subunit alcohol dehydrogenase family)